ncbi:MAG TPA: preprotein translocase subunit Sec61beta [Candidatus Lokiarchaeia archaeon]|nr:preprotein translocase subunit Sec61beta [Candidatus Lokiarchaeia archaeon]
MSQKKKSKRSRRRGSEGPMPMGGAGLIRFFQDESTGVKIGPIATVLLAVLLVVLVIMAQNGIFKWLFGF